MTDLKDSLESMKALVTQLSDRAKRLSQTRESLIKQSATLEQQQAQAVEDLKALGVTVDNLDPEALSALADKANADLSSAIEALEKSLTEAETLVGTSAA